MLIDGWKSFFPERVATWRAERGDEAARAARRARAAAIHRGAALVRRQGRADQRAQACVDTGRDGRHAHGSWLLALFDVETAARLGAATSCRSPSSTKARTKRAGRSCSPPRSRACGSRPRSACSRTPPPTRTSAARWSRPSAQAASCALEHGIAAFLRRRRPTRELRGDPADSLATSPPRNQGSNTTLRVGEQLFLKLYRRLQNGMNPEVEIGRFLTEVAHFPNIVPVAGAVEYRGNDGTTYTLALLQAFVMNQGDGWDYTVNYLVRFLEDRRTGGAAARGRARRLHRADARCSAQRTAELHVALAICDGRSGVRAGADHARRTSQAWTQSVHAERDETLDAARGVRRRAAGERCARMRSSSPSAARACCAAHRSLRRHERPARPEDALPRRLSPRPGAAEAQRLHHRGLRRRAGPPARGAARQAFAAARRRRHVPLVRLRAAGGACSAAPSSPAEDCAKWEPLLADWETGDARNAFLEVYDEIARAPASIRASKQRSPLLELFEIEKALYELRYELRNRPRLGRHSAAQPHCLSRHAWIKDRRDRSQREPSRRSVARPALSARRDLGWRRRQFRACSPRTPTKVELCLFDPSGRRELQRIELRERTDEVVARLSARGAARACSTAIACTGRTTREHGHRFNPQQAADRALRQAHPGRAASGATRTSATASAIEGGPVVRQARQRGRHAEVAA